jgi:competence transcription factor ComK
MAEIMFMHACITEIKTTVNSVFQPSTFYDRRCKFASEYWIHEKKITRGDKCNKTLKISRIPPLFQAAGASGPHCAYESEQAKRFHE